jgi:hypothetical protein
LANRFFHSFFVFGYVRIFFVAHRYLAIWDAHYSADITKITEKGGIWRRGLNLVLTVSQSNDKGPRLILSTPAPALRRILSPNSDFLHDHTENRDAFLIFLFRAFGPSAEQRCCGSLALIVLLMVRVSAQFRLPNAIVEASQMACAEGAI